jgi:putative transposase
MTTQSATLQLVVGKEVVANERRGTILEIVSPSLLRIAYHDNSAVEEVSVSDVAPVPVQSKYSPSMESLSDEQLSIARKRYKAIRQLVGLKGRTEAAVKKRASEVGVHFVTLYKWLKLYEESNLLTSLVSNGRSDKGAKKLDDDVEQIISEVIETEYLSRQRKTPAYVCKEVQRRCIEADLTPPHPNTIRKRLKAISDFKRVARRSGSKEAIQKYSPIQGEFPGADWPLAVVEIDHTPLDIILVDDIYRHPIGRPWITLAMDVFSRMVTGFHISLDPPSATSVGLCLAHCILPKDKWLAKRGIDGDWPCYGVPKTIHADNAREFRGEMLGRACEQYGVDLEWRPVARPHFGAHVERLLGTFAKEIHTLPGTTFSNTQERGRYDSEGKAVFTLGEFEVWLSTYIVQVYHYSLHSAFNMPPIEKYKLGILGDDSRPGIGLPPRIVDEERLRLDFLPHIRRTIQKYGVAIDKIYYWHDVLRRWIDALDPDNQKIKRKFLFRRDPRDLSVVWFFDPELQTYYPIPYRDTSHPPINIWELKEARRKLTESGRKQINEGLIFEALSRIRELEELAKGKTKAVRRAHQRRVAGIGDTSGRIKVVENLSTPDADFDDEDIKPFDEMDDML